MRLKFADIFAGCGGLSYGFATNDFYKGILAADSWEMARQTYSYNHPSIPFEKLDMYDNSHISAAIKMLKGQCDILIGGPPCQGFSTLGKREEDCKKSRLVDTFLKIALSVKPKIIVMENVKGLLSKKHDSGVLYPQFVTNSLEQGRTKYYVHQGLINSLEYGIAQTRTRYILIAVRSDVQRSQDLLHNIVQILSSSRTEAYKTVQDAIGDLPEVGAEGGNQEITVTRSSEMITIFNHESMKHSLVLQKRLQHVPPGGGLLDVPKRLLTPHLKKMVDGAYGSGGHVKNIYGRLEWDKPCGTIVAGMDKITCGRYVHPVENRLLTPRECARIQSYPDSFRFFGSLVSQYYLVGNSVPPKISEVIANAINKAICLGQESL